MMSDSIGIFIEISMASALQVARGSQVWVRVRVWVLIWVWVRIWVRVLLRLRLQRFEWPNDERQTSSVFAMAKYVYIQASRVNSRYLSTLKVQINLVGQQF